MNASQRIELLVQRQARADVRRTARFVEAMRRSALAERQMIRLRHEMSKVDRIVTRLVRGDVSSAIEDRKFERELAQVVKNIGGTPIRR